MLFAFIITLNQNRKIHFCNILISCQKISKAEYDAILRLECILYFDINSFLFYFHLKLIEIHFLMYLAIGNEQLIMNSLKIFFDQNKTHFHMDFLYLRCILVIYLIDLVFEHSLAVNSYLLSFIFIAKWIGNISYAEMFGSAPPSRSISTT